MNEYGDCVVFKLMNGEQVIARFLEEEDSHYVFEDLVLVRSIQVPVEGGTIEKTITTPYCPISEDAIFRFSKNHVLFIKPVDTSVARMYGKLIKSFNDSPPEFDPDDSFNDEPEDHGFLVIPEDSKIH